MVLILLLKFWIASCGVVNDGAWQQHKPPTNTLPAKRSVTALQEVSWESAESAHGYECAVSAPILCPGEVIAQMVIDLLQDKE